MPVQSTKADDSPAEEFQIATSMSTPRSDASDVPWIVFGASEGEDDIDIV